MTYEEFLNFVPSNCMYETIYDDSDGRTILVIKLLDAFSMVNKTQRTWVGLTDDEIASLHYKIKVQLMGAYKTEDIYRTIEAYLKEKNT